MQAFTHEISLRRSHEKNCKRVVQSLLHVESGTARGVQSLSHIASPDTGSAAVWKCIRLSRQWQESIQQ